MHKQFILFSSFFAALTLAFCAQAEIYKSIDADGHVTYSNVKSKGAKKLELEPADTSFGGDSKPSRRANTKSATPENFPKVDAETQKKRDSSRKDILLSELEAEKKALEDAKKAAAQADEQPEMARGKDGKYFKNMGKHEEKMKPFNAEVDAHQRNVELLQKEISSTP